MELASTEKLPTPIRHETIFVQPETPTALHGRETFKISDGNNMTIRFGLSSLHVVGGTLDPARFCSALSRTLQWFPTAAGRLKRVGDDWQIDLINDAVPVHLASSPSRHVLPHTSAEGDGDPPAAAHVVQPSSHVAPYLARVDPVAARKGEPNAHLCTFVLTDMGDGRTVIGLSWNQVLGDQTTEVRFIHALSAYYIALLPDSSGKLPQPTFGSPNPNLWVAPPAPVFHSRVFPPFPPEPLSPALEALVRGTAPQMLRSHPREELEQIREEVLNTDEVTLRFDRWEIDALWERARADAGDGAVGAGELAVEKVTRHDALIAYLVTLHNRCSGEAPIHTVLHLMNVRLHQPPADTAQHLLHRHPDVVGNGSQIPSIPLHNKRRNDALVGGERGAWFSESLYEVAEGAAAWPAWVDSAAPSPVAAEVQEVPPEAAQAQGASPLAPYTSLGLIARAFRRGTRLARADNWTERFLRIKYARYREASLHDRSYVYPAPGTVLVNSLLGVDVRDVAHFGLGIGQTYQEVSWERMFRVHNANPTRRAKIGSPSKWEWQDPEDAVVVCFRVKNGLKERMEETKARDTEALRKAGPSQKRSHLARL